MACRSEDYSWLRSENIMRDCHRSSFYTHVVGRSRGMQIPQTQGIFHAIGSFSKARSKSSFSISGSQEGAAGSSVQFGDATRPSHAPSAPPWNLLSVAWHTQTPLRLLSRVPVFHLAAPPRFARHPPKFRGIHFPSVGSCNALVLRAEIDVLLAKDAIKPVAPADMKTGFYSPYCTQERRWVKANLGPANLESGPAQAPVQDANAETHFRMHPSPRLVCSDRHSPFLCFAFEGRAYQYKVLPFRLSLSPRVFMKVVEAAIVPLRERAVRIRYYLDDWLILAQSRD
ncbi:hypothetical protein PO909_017904 [Leuciscus waleckii]